MLTTTKVTDLRTAVAAIREAAIPAKDPVADRYDLPFIGVQFNTYIHEELTVRGLCADTYREQGEYGSFVRVVHLDDVAPGEASALFRLDPAKPWIEAVEDVVDWLATETPIESVPCG